MSFPPYTFANLAGDQPASKLDANFAACAPATDLTALTATVAALPAVVTPGIPAVGGVVGVSATLAHGDHQHPPQTGLGNVQTGTSYTVTDANMGQTIYFTNGSAIAVTFANTLSADFNCVIYQWGAGQITFSAQASGTQRQASSYTKTRAQYSGVTCNVKSNAGTAPDYVLSGDMA